MLQAHLLARRLAVACCASAGWEDAPRLPGTQAISYKVAMETQKKLNMLRKSLVWDWLGEWQEQGCKVILWLNSGQILKMP